MRHAKAAEYYNRAKILFYTDQENNPIVCLQSIMLFYWWAPRGPALVHKDAAWWWTGIAIKYAQQMGLHREPKNVCDVGGDAVQGLRRRIWWTLFARERLTGMCQGRPLTINPEDCNVREVSLEDFGSSEDARVDVFIYWVRLCGIIGRVSQHLSRNLEQALFPTTLAEELIGWAHSLPSHLELPDMADRARKFNRDVLKLHLPYLTTVTILHLNWSSQHPSQPWPEAYTAAVLSASCVTRIFKDFLARGEIRFLGAIACWYVGVAIIALLQTQQIDCLAECGAEDIRILRLALNELASLWPSTAIFVKGFDRLRAFESLGARRDGGAALNPQVPRTTGNTATSGLSDLNWPHGVDWQSYFPHVTTRTCGLAGILLAEPHQPEIWGDLSWLGDATTYFQDLFDSSDALLDPYLENLSALCRIDDQIRL
ncbi:uncharacterized protein A1O5_07886 [Cladophialophora psammophila CBS 110553]|uniref:Xylanolytic transcriptional activator regulatory domain-containing protein n=1 Tax=Cladophialophora psammophila CBS 110553 TaxID=1182543 RepID=W9XF03_9EURO|nr:uncharacterized protein A1O5_07886 [Cladophialophora psammophila CBS 110553]EXJ68954.1 hypothetical protein A1O5_07886 [Cladophialophora psammophila CBS 110553]